MDKPLKVSLTKDTLYIEIGIGINAFAFEKSDWNNPWSDAKRDFVRTFKVTDPIAFARDVKSAMLDELEDGSSPLSNFLDKMAIAAVEDGSEGIEYPE